MVRLERSVKFAALLVTAGLLWAAPVAAGVLVPSHDAGYEPAVPNVPDRYGCVRLCEQDTAPCDPPIYKRADGRCTGDY